MMQQLFDELTTNAPPSTVDIDAIVARERRAMRRRRIAGTGATALAVAVLGLLIQVDPRPPEAPPAAESTPSVETVQDTASRLTDALRYAVSREAPTAELSSVDGGAGAPLEVSYQVCGAAEPPRTLPMAYMASARVRVDDRDAVLVFEAGARVADAFCAKTVSIPPGTESPGPAGERVFTRLTPDGSKASVFVARPDGTFVHLYLHRAEGQIPLTVAQLTAIAVDRALEL